MQTKAEFWFDPMCPWAFITSRWILEVEKVRDIEITWNIFSLPHLNKDREMPERYKAIFASSWACARVIKAVENQYGKEKTLPLYTAISTRIHVLKESVSQEFLNECLKEIGADSKYALEMNNSDWDKEIIQSHERGIKLVGDDVGTPIIAINGIGFFGPVISPAPKGEEAGKLWDGVVLSASYPGFFEIKRSRTVGPIFD
jgi:protein-disulfide isomerase-like protein with CxxC motif